MEDDSVDCIEISSKSYDSFRTSLILLKIYDQKYEKEKYLLKEYQLIDLLADIVSMRHSRKINTFIDLIQAYHEEKELLKRIHQNDSGKEAFISIFVFSIKKYIFQIREMEYIYKLILLANQAAGLKQLQRYFRIRKQILNLGLSNPRGQPLFLDGLSLSFDEWSGFVCKILGSDAIMSIGEQIRNFNQKCNRIDKVLQNSAEALICIKLILKHLRSKKNQEMLNQKGDNLKTSSMNDLLQQQPTQAIIQNNQKPSSQGSFNLLSTQTYLRQSFQMQPKNSSNNDMLTSAKLISKQKIPISSSKSPIKQGSYSQISKAKNQRSTTPLSESALRLQTMSETPQIFLGADIENIFLINFCLFLTNDLDAQKLKIGKKKVIEEDFNDTFQHNRQAVSKNGIIIQNDLAFKYQDLANFTKDLLAAVKRVLLLSNKGVPLSQEEQMNLLKRSRFNGVLISDPFTLLKDSVSLANPGGQKTLEKAMQQKEF